VNIVLFPSNDSVVANLCIILGLLSLRHFDVSLLIQGHRFNCRVLCGRYVFN